MASSDAWPSVVVGIFGFIGIGVSGYVGYNSGEKSVDKDYVQIATGLLEKKGTSPDLRKWSVDVLSSLSPVPFGERLKSELSNNGIAPTRYVFERTSLPKVLSEPCPDLLKGSGKAIDERLALKVTNAYEKCRFKQQGLVDLITKLNDLADKLNEDQKVGGDKLNQDLGIGNAAD